MSGSCTASDVVEADSVAMAASKLVIPGLPSADTLETLLASTLNVWSSSSSSPLSLTLSLPLLPLLGLLVQLPLLWLLLLPLALSWGAMMASRGWPPRA